MNQDNIKIIPAVSRKDLNEVRQLFQEYAQSLGFDLSFQDFDRELRELPGDYAAPSGCLLLAACSASTAGCIALRKMVKNVCEMKRLYVRPEFRGKGIGKMLALAIIKEAYRIGYKYMRLDTVPAMKEAISLYRTLGFQEIDPYRYNPIEGAIFMELRLK